MTIIIISVFYSMPKKENKTGEKVVRLFSKRVWVNGKSLKECLRKDKEINNNTIKCRSGYYKEIKTK